ncbi:MAG: asparaginase [Clostridiales bacterium]|nr:asparaginase [Clostridiales bacterium]
MGKYMKKLLLISTGGTISCSDTERGLSPMLTFDELLEKVPYNDMDVIIDGIQLMSIDSGNIIPKHWLDITKEINDKYDIYDGFLVTHGTDTLAYTSAALSYLIQHSKKPIIVTGSQRPIESKGNDAINNLTQSIAFACEGIGGVFVVFNGKVIHGTQVRKIRTKDNDAFISLNRLDVAQFIDKKIVYDKNFQKEYRIKSKNLQFYNKLNTNVHVIKLFPGLNTKAFKYMLNIYDAIVIEAYGTGSIPFVFGDAIEEFHKQNKEDCLILVVSQAMFEGTNMKLYEISNKVRNFPNVIEGGLMSTESAVTKLMWALAKSKTNQEVITLIKEPVDFDF